MQGAQNCAQSLVILSGLLRVAMPVASTSVPGRPDFLWARAGPTGSGWGQDTLIGFFYWVFEEFR